MLKALWQMSPTQDTWLVVGGSWIASYLKMFAINMAFGYGNLLFVDGDVTLSGCLLIVLDFHLISSCD